MSQQQGNYYLQLNILAYALMGAVLLAALTAAFVQSKEGVEINEDLADVLVPVALFIGLAGGVASDYLFRKRVESIHPEQDLQSRMTSFRTATIMQLALLEGPAIVGVVVFLLTGATLPMIMAIVLLGWMTLNRPSMARLVKFMHLTESEQEQLLS